MRANPQETADLVKFVEQILNGKLHFLCSDNNLKNIYFEELLRANGSRHVAIKKPECIDLFVVVTPLNENSTLETLSITQND